MKTSSGSLNFRCSQPACLTLHDRGIRTLWSSANAEDPDQPAMLWLRWIAKPEGHSPLANLDTADTLGVAGLVVDFQSLNEENQRRALREHPVFELDDFSYGMEKIVVWTHPITAETPVVEVAEAAMRFASSFEDQSAD